MMKRHRGNPETAEAAEAAEAAAAAEAPAVSESAGAPEATVAPGVAEAGERVAALEAELAELKDRYLRLAADYDNFRKRANRERDELRLRSQAELVRRLIEELDDLGRVAHLDPAATAAADVISGIELVERKFLRELGAAGMVVINTVDVPFDPAVHEAVTTIPTDDEAKDHTVAAVFQVGYRFNGTLLRPARVQVRMLTPAD
jgi:molecular chaperone GrpE